MFISYTDITLIMGLACIIMVLRLTRRSLLHPVYALWWSCVSILAVAVGAFPQAVNFLDTFLGVAYTPILLAIAFLIIAARLLMADIRHTQTIIQVRSLAQKHAQLACEFEKLKENLKK